MSKLSDNRRACALALAVLVLGGLAAYAYLGDAEPTAEPAGLFASYDRDGNGVAHLSEVPNERRGQFKFLLERAGSEEVGALTRVQFERVLRQSKESRNSRDGSQVAAAGSEKEFSKPPTDPAHSVVRQGQDGSDALRPTPALDAAPGEHASLADREPSQPTAGDLLFTELDQNGDGAISRAEFVASYERVKSSRLASVVKAEPAAASTVAKDSDQPNAVVAADSAPAPTGEESEGRAADAARDAAAKPVSYSRKRLFVSLDRNGDGVMQEAEIPQTYRSDLLRGDANGDRRLSLQEFSAGVDQMKVAEGPPAATVQPTGSRSRGGLVSRPAPGKPTPTYQPRKSEAPDVAGLPAWFRQRDENQDDQVAQHEWPASELAEFRRVDTNNDGFISLGEATAESAESDARNPGPA